MNARTANGGICFRGNRGVHSRKFIPQCAWANDDPSSLNCEVVSLDVDS